MTEKQTNNDSLDFQNFFKTAKRLGEIFDYKVTDAKVIEYHRVLSSWQITDELFPAIVDEVLKKCHRFPALAAFWAAKVETDPWGPSR